MLTLFFDPAALGYDFTVPNPFQATFDPGMVTQGDNNTTVSGCQALQDDSVEGPHSFEVMLDAVPSEFSGVVTVDPTPLTVTILDDDGECVDQ